MDSPSRFRDWAASQPLAWTLEKYFVKSQTVDRVRAVWIGPEVGVSSWPTPPPRRPEQLKVSAVISQQAGDTFAATGERIAPPPCRGDRPRSWLAVFADQFKYLPEYYSAEIEASCETRSDETAQIGEHMLMKSQVMISEEAAAL